MSKNRSLKSQMVHRVSEMYRRGYGVKAGERKKMRDKKNVHVISMKKTRDLSVRVANDFCVWMKSGDETKKIKTMEEAGKFVKHYRENLIEKGYSPATVHTYIDRLNQILGTTVKTSRAGSVPVKGRNQNTEIASRNDAKREYSPRLTNFAEAVGLRRAEYSKLSYSDIVPSGDTYKIAVVGKGGKYQEQLILPQYKEEIEKILGENHYPDDKIFSKKEMTNKINLHEIRREVAHNAYKYYEELVKDPEKAKELYGQLKETYVSRNPEKELPRDYRWIEKNGLDDIYKCRGAVKEDLLKKGLPVQYSRLVTLAVSVNHLSHWRCDVTIQNYFR